ncbi:aminopeptidase [Parendozoicomonas sp. Alg238-R29]|uniref:aminopeptidase n=1 Tax=Parendozoicomonas sp. Alg238-R29 TaxID=2993446 RepID=UPI00248E4470|nr:aminopeptidase [Parendozoicomonas sp. Alg238-R29]
MLYKQESGWKQLKGEERQEIINFCEPYKAFLNKAKTEREFVIESQKLAEERGFVDAMSKDVLNPGDKVFFNLRDKNLVLAVIGSENISEGVNFVVSHVDSPRLDLKQKPLYEDSEFGLLKTHYYGGVKKYQWASRPLALHGVVALKSGTKVNITIGEDESDPVFVIPDLLPHLDQKVQRDRKASEVLKGSEMHVLVGSIPCEITDEDIKDQVKYNVLQKLNEQYDMTEADFISAELELVPAEKARDVGLDRGLIGAYGHDDRICAWTSVQSIIGLDHTPERTAVCFLVDKEEIGSNGSTGLESRYIEHFMEELAARMPASKDDRHAVRRSFWNSRALSSDVNAGLNPLFKQVHDSQNASRLGYGIVLTKYTGARGKNGSNDADAEFVGELRALFDSHDITWQTGMLGEVDEGGGGTVAMLLAQYGIRTIDAGAALLSMHSPMEIASKFDVHEIYRAYKAFYA